jgi:hypothetical protein
MSDRTLIVASFAVLYDKRSFIKDGRDKYIFSTIQEAINFWVDKTGLMKKTAHVEKVRFNSKREMVDWINEVYNAG